MRKYYPAWHKLKTEGKIILVTPKHLHKRVIKAIMKERSADTGFRLELAEQDRCAKVFATSKDNMIRFTLKYYLSPEDL